MNPSLEQHERVKMRLRLVGSSLAAVARELRVAPTSVTSVSQGFRRSRRIEAAIAGKLGEAPECLWQDRYPDGGQCFTLDVETAAHAVGGESPDQT